MERRVIIPAAGKGTRLHSKESDAPKAMRLCLGKPLLEMVLASTSFIPKENTYIVVGYKKEEIIRYFGPAYHYAEQKEQLGTGHAVMTCRDAFEDFKGTVLVTFGDMPLFKKTDMEALCDRLEAADADCMIVTAENPDLTLWARIKRDENGNFKGIVEGKDCTEEEAKIKELFSGIIAFKSESLFKVLPELHTDNAQGEYYLTEVPELMVRRGMKVETFGIADGDSLRGVNTLEDLHICEEVARRRKGLGGGNEFNTAE